MPQTLLTASFSFCWQALPRVSRSFALGISLLPAGLKDAVMVSYLLFRMSDTIEDSFLSHPKKRALLRVLQTQLNTLTPSERLFKTFITGLDNYNFGRETFLLHHARDVLFVFFSLPRPIQQIICHWLTEMNTHVWQYNTKKIRTFAEQNKYCYYVAGVVGHLLTDLFSFYGQYSTQKKHELHLLAADFGLALQKVNIIKDIYKDVQEKRYYWPLNLLRRYHLTYTTLFLPQQLLQANYVLEDLVADVKHYADKTVAYILALPKRSFRVRLFCGLSLFMALLSLHTYRRRSYDLFAGTEVKMPRRRVYLLLLELSLLLHSNLLFHQRYIFLRRRCLE